MELCRSCGNENSDGATVCSACGAALTPEHARMPDARKTVTIVFADVSESTRLGEQLDAELLRYVMSRYFASASRALRNHGATVEKFIGDAVMAVFGSPAVHEDDALRAVRAAVEMRAAVEELSMELERERGIRIEVSIGVNTGEVVVGDPSARQLLVTGDAVNVAARMQQVAEPGDILLGETTRRLVREAVQVAGIGELELKGKADGVLAWRLLEVLDDVSPYARRLDSPLIGRARELSQLRQAFDHVAEERTAYLFTVLGSAGIGKSRLAVEFLSTLGEAATVVGGRCLPYGDGITFWPLLEIIEELRGDEDPGDAVARVIENEEGADLIGERMAVALGRSQLSVSAEETFWAIRKFFGALAREKPVVILLEDIHWGEPTFFDLVENIAAWSRDAPLLVLCLARSELIERRPGWAGGALNATSVLLEPLTYEESGELIDHLAGAEEVSRRVRERILETAEGNPLFVEQLLAMLAETPAPKRRLEVPPTIQALLAARLDNLSPSERAAIERSSVVGKRFWVGAVAAMSPPNMRDTVADDIRRLVRKELIRPDRPLVAGEEGYRFQHILIRDAAYSGIPKEVRADLHEAFALIVEETAGERVKEVEELIGYHLEQAFRYRQELRTVDERATTVAAEASERFVSAGERALGRGDATAAVNLLERAAALRPADLPGREGVLADLGAALVLAGQFARADATLSDAIEAAAAAGYRGLELHGLLERAFLRALTRPEGVEELNAVAEQAIAELAELGDERGLAKAWRRVADAAWMANQWAEQERALKESLLHAERAGDVREMAGALMRLPMAIYYGPTPVPEAIARAELVLQHGANSRVVQSTSLVCLAGLNAMSGRFDISRTMLADGRAIADELGFKVWLAGFSILAGEVELLADDPAASETELRRGYDALEAMGDRGLLSTVAAELARTLYVGGNDEEAEQFTRVSEELAGAGDVTAQISWRAVRAKILARRGDGASAEALAREALRLVELTDGLNNRGRMLVDLAEVLTSSGRGDAAVAYLERALEAFEAKGNLVSAGKVRARLSGRSTSPV